MGLWGHPESEQSRRKQVHPGAVSLSDPLGESLYVPGWFIPPSQSPGPMCSVHLMFKVLLTCYTKSATKAGPLPDPMLVGNPNLGTISLSRHRATSDGLSVQVGKAFTHLGNVHTMASR